MNCSLLNQEILGFIAKDARNLVHGRLCHDYLFVFVIK